MRAGVLIHDTLKINRLERYMAPQDSGAVQSMATEQYQTRRWEHSADL